MIGPPLTLERQELPASLGKITILAVAVTKNGRKHGDPTEQLDKKSLGDLHKIEFGETSPSRGGRRCLSLSVLRAFSSIYRRRAVSRRRFTVKGPRVWEEYCRALPFPPATISRLGKKKEDVWLFFHGESTPACRGCNFYPFPAWEPLACPGTRGGV